MQKKTETPLGTNPKKNRRKLVSIIARVMAKKIGNQLFLF